MTRRPIQVWRPSPSPTVPSPAQQKQTKPVKPKILPPPPTRTQLAKAKRRAANQIIKQRADAIYSAIHAGCPVEDILAQGFEAEWVYRYLLLHVKKFRLWRQAVALFEAGVNPVHVLGQVEASPTKLAGWYTSWKEHGGKLPAIIPTGCEGVE